MLRIALRVAVVFTVLWLAFYAYSYAKGVIVPVWP
jgi:hypothetical protein